jgi:hypothetical protein
MTYMSLRLTHPPVPAISHAQTHCFQSLHIGGNTWRGGEKGKVRREFSI